MALPSVGGAAKEGGRQALQAVQSPFKNIGEQITSPFKKVTAPLTSFLKEAEKNEKKDKKDGYKANHLAKMDAQKKEEEKQSGLLEKILNALTDGNKLDKKSEDYDRKRDAKKDRQAKAAKADARLADDDDIGMAALATAGRGDEVEDDGGDQKKGPFAAIAKIAKSLIAKVTMIGLIVLPALAAFFNSEAFTKIKEFVVDRWPGIKKFFVGMFAVIGDFFQDMTENFNELFTGEDNIAVRVAKFAGNMLNDIGQMLISAFDNVIELVGDLFGVDFGEDPVRNFVKSIGGAISDAFSGIANAGKNLYAQIYADMPDVVKKLLPKPSGETNEDRQLKKDGIAEKDLTAPENEDVLKRSLANMLDKGELTQEEYDQGIANIEARAAERAQAVEGKDVKPTAEPAKATQGEDKAAVTQDIAEMSADKTAPNVTVVTQNTQNNQNNSGTQTVVTAPAPVIPMGF